MYRLDGADDVEDDTDHGDAENERESDLLAKLDTQFFQLPKG